MGLKWFRFPTKFSLAPTPPDRARAHAILFGPTWLSHDSIIGGKGSHSRGPQSGTLDSPINLFSYF